MAYPPETFPAPGFPQPTILDHDGMRLAHYVAGPEDGPPVILLHGWPELAYSWAHQVRALSDAGFRVVVPELRGFGASDAPSGVEHYGIAQLVGDVEAVIDQYGFADVSLVGHDWGGIIAWQAARMLGDATRHAWGRIRRVASICTPMVRHAPVDPMRIFERRFGAEHYFLVFQRDPEGTADLFARDPDAFFAMMFRTVPDNYPRGEAVVSAFTYIPKNFAEHLARGAPELAGQVLNADQRKVYADGYRASGFGGGIALYRNTTANWDLVTGLDERLTVPALMISPEDDRLLPPSATDHMPAMCANLRRMTIPDCGHWAMWEQPDAVNAILLDWLAEREPEP